MTPATITRSIRILNVEPLGYSTVARSLLTQVAELAELEMSRADLLKVLGAYDVLIVRLRHQIDRDVIEAGRRLKAIVSATTGLDHVDLECARARGVTVLSLRDESQFLRDVSATAEHAWALLLALQRRIVPASASVSRGEWNRDLFRGHELKGKCLGILGLGRVGKMVARYGLAFEMKVAAHDPFASEWVDGVERKATLSDLLECSTVLSLHIPFRPENTAEITARELNMLPQGAVLINTSRGELIDEMALVETLEKRHLAGAAVDVIRGERTRQRPSSPLLAYASTHDNLLITPHIGGATHESMAKTEIFMAQKLLRFLAERQDTLAPSDT